MHKHEWTWKKGQRARQYQRRLTGLEAFVKATFWIMVVAFIIGA